MTHTVVRAHNERIAPRCSTFERDLASARAVICFAGVQIESLAGRPYTREHAPSTREHAPSDTDRVSREHDRRIEALPIVSGRDRRVSGWTRLAARRELYLG